MYPMILTTMSVNDSVNFIMQLKQKTKNKKKAATVGYDVSFEKIEYGASSIVFYFCMAPVLV